MGEGCREGVIPQREKGDAIGSGGRGSQETLSSTLADSTGLLEELEAGPATPGECRLQPGCPRTARMSKRRPGVLASSA